MNTIIVFARLYRLNLLSRSAFTLVELLVVMAILGILIAVAIAGIGIAQRGARDNTRIRDLTNIKTGLENFYGSTRSYPTYAQVVVPAGGATFTIASAPAVKINQGGASKAAVLAAAPTIGTCGTPSASAWAFCYGLVTGTTAAYWLGATLENGTLYDLST